MYDMGLRPNASSTVKEGRTYRFFTGEPVYPFGFGRFYTEFDVAPASATPPPPVSGAVISAALAAGPKARYSTEPLATIHVRVTNVGKVASRTSVLAYVSAPGAGENGLPLRSLAAFDSVPSIAPGTSTVVSLSLDAYALSVVGVDGNHAPLKGEWTVALSDSNRTVTLTVT